MHQFKLLYFLITITLLEAFTFKAECSTEKDFQSWINITANGNFHKQDKTSSRIKYWLEGQQRIGDDSTHFTQTLFRPGIGYALTVNLSLWLGYAWVYTGYPLTSKPFEENRIWQQLLWIKTTRYLTWMSRTRMEQRFLENNSKTALRARQLLKISIPLNHYKKFSFVSSNELFWHKNNFIGRNSSGFDQNRLFIGFGYQINPQIITEIGYMNQYIRRFGVPNFLSNIISVNFFLSL
jgi:hypothetical protein